LDIYEEKTKSNIWTGKETFLMGHKQLKEKQKSIWGASQKTFPFKLRFIEMRLFNEAREDPPENLASDVAEQPLVSRLGINSGAWRSH
jgi:hypothetical protein